MFEHLELDDLLGLGHPDRRHEIADPFGGKAAAAQSRDGRHPRVVPAAHVALVDEAQKHALGHDGVRQVESRELVLMGTRRHRKVVDEPVVERPVGFELERADGVGDALDGVGLPVGKVVGRVDRPGVAGARMCRVDDPVQYRVAEIDVGRGHVDLRPQHARPVGELAGAHAREEVEALLRRPVPPGALAAGLGERAAVLADLVGREVVDVRLAGLDEVDGPLVELLEVVGGEVQVLAPVEPQPADVGLDGIDVLLLFFGGVRVVETQVVAPAVLASDAEAEADRLRMADVEVAVRLRGKAGDDGLDPALAEVGGDDLADEVAALARGSGRRWGLGAHSGRG